ncbi:hypothetical protein WA026_019750 [Henosepilachna vigintioctopunctata]|uniref:BTB domain-containing protein n=1 Tax=Henosepilachna vigintioctopunctata TaxID=420089 RepID=A0AAW1UEX6_9CUCU
MEGEQFSLCWNNFHSNLSSGFQALYKEENLVDVTLAAEGRHIKAHKTVLSICSPFFKELFRANPCEHPIVILQDVNYAALCSLLQFMYQGQVSVGQEEIPMFMRVAETLKVKGLTDNGSSNLDTNGINNFSGQKNVMKKPLRPVKKLIKPMQLQQQRHVSSPTPSTVKSPLPTTSMPPAKKMHLEETHHQMPINQSITNLQSHQLHQQHQPAAHNPEYEEPLLQPKMEPIDPPEDDDSTRQSFGEEQYDISSMMSQSFEENSADLMPPGWMPDANHDASSPGEGRLVFLRSGRGQLVLVHNGHMYTLGKAKDDKYMWICVKKKTYNCNGCVVTMEGPVLLARTAHNHPQLNDVIKKLQVPSALPMTALNMCKKDNT